MRVLLINPNTIKPPVAPIGIDYMADTVVASGHQPLLLDLCFEPDIESAVRGQLGSVHPDLIGITIRNTDDCYFSSRRFFLPEVRELVSSLRSLSSAPVVLGGVGYSVAPAAVLQFCGADFGIAGDGEFALVELINALDRHHDPRGIPGLCYRMGEQVRLNPPRAVDLGSLPPRSRAFIDNARYFREGGQGGFETKRGCPMECCYCADPIAKGRRVRTVPPVKVVKELEALLDQGVDHLHTCDSEFNLPPEHALAVCEEIVRAGLGERIRWYAYCLPAPFTADMAEQFRRAGCAGINFGADSGSDEMLARLGRHFRANDLERTAFICHKHSIPFMFDLLIGGPGETLHTVAQTIELMRRLDPDCVGVSVGVRLYPGTQLADQVAAAGTMQTEPLHGATAGNPEMLEPVFYLSPNLGDDARSVLTSLVQDDPRFFLPESVGTTPGYNYNDNKPLTEAIRNGSRGAYWDILRRLRKTGTI
ncbi:MAG: radical SAM protein [Verrucomicrobiota bacterium]|nr:radical SAM protein [Verrucomicrobiota bacterium]